MHGGLIKVVSLMEGNQMSNVSIRCMIFHRWRNWTVLRMRTISYFDWIAGIREETDYYCRKCEREWTVKRYDY